ncbi:hypothetical protein KBD87_01335 [Candidatus Saccharibacteria bacterium]|nr:hypothetical protein [Candidatus Saccharibacteria bacterium]
MIQLLTALLSVVAVVQLTYLIFRQHQPRLRNTSDSRPVFVDTSALMDGRIVVAAKTGFVPAKLVVPRSVIAELQLLADTADSDKRTKARRGLDAVNELKDMENVEIEVYDDGQTGKGGVDDRLLELAKKYQGTICTIDYNLNKVAQTEGIFVLNINELAGNVRMAFLPGEKVSLGIVQKGNDPNQGVGYLNDGTMVVVEQAASDVGKTVEVEFIRSLQTAAGRMMFAKKQSKAKPAGSKLSASSKHTSKKTNYKRTNSSKPKTAEDNMIELANKS